MWDWDDILKHSILVGWEEQIVGTALVNIGHC